MKTYRPSELDREIDTLVARLQRIREEYRWASTAVWSAGTRDDDERVSGGDVSRPVEQLIVGHRRAQARRRFEQVTRQLRECFVVAAAAEGVLARLFEGLDDDLAEPEDDPAHRPISAAELDEARRQQAKRHARGDGYGDS